jgi:hypothetical protein
MLAQNEYERILANLDHDDDEESDDEGANDVEAPAPAHPTPAHPTQRTSSLAGRKRGIEEASKQGLCLFYILHFSDPIYKLNNYKPGEMNLNLTIHLFSKSTY